MNEPGGDPPLNLQKKKAEPLIDKHQWFCAFKRQALNSFTNLSFLKGTVRKHETYRIG